MSGNRKICPLQPSKKYNSRKNPDRFQIVIFGKKLFKFLAGNGTSYQSLIVTANYLNQAKVLILEES